MRASAVASSNIHTHTTLCLSLPSLCSALDPESEQVVKDALEAQQGKRTTITVAHRLITVMNADTIAVVREGRVSELGTHSELVSRNGWYAEMWRAQTGN